MALTVFTRIPVTKTVSVIFFTSMAIADLCNGLSHLKSVVSAHIIDHVLL